MTVLYELFILGAPLEEELEELRQAISAATQPFGLKLGEEISWVIHRPDVQPSPKHAAAAAFFGAPSEINIDLSTYIKSGIPILPIVSKLENVKAEIPEALRKINCISSEEGMPRVASTLLECLGLLPRQRRVFLSYRRDEARQAALQLFDALSTKVFEVFIDTHGISPAEDFQTMLWHRLCDSDVLIMLDTPGYFDSRWTSAEFGRALAKGISVLRIGWPDSTPSMRTLTASRAELISEEINASTGQISTEALDRICRQVELVRSESHAVRQINLASSIRIAVEKISGRVLGVGPNNAMHIELADGREITAYPAVGVPTSMTLQAAAEAPHSGSAAVVYDHVGLHPTWLTHLDWLGGQIRNAKWVKASEAAWMLADWES